MAQDQSYAHPEFLTDAAWVSQHLEDVNIWMVDCDVPDQYTRAHIPGAVFMVDHYQKDPNTNRVHILGPQTFASLMESLGIGDDTLVVGYDNSRGIYAARLWWALNYYGHTNVKVMNGGWRQWLSQGLPITTTQSQPPTGAKFTPQVNASLMVTTDQLMEDYQKDDVVVWDVRSRGEYTGEATRGNQRTGHIAGAAHLEWLNLVDDDTHLLKPAAEMRRLLESHGITPDKRIEAH
jgi:thiosulfate/3-mercaptopyruvate sulfurtransferase